MGKLYRRMLREIHASFGQFLSITLIIAIGAMLMSGMFSSITAMDTSTQQYYEEQNLADLWVYFKNIDTDEANALILSSGARQAQARYTYNETVQLGGEECTLRLHSLTDINRPLLTQGELPDQEGEIILDYKFAQLNGLSEGGSITLGEDKLTITGLFMNPEYAYKQKDSSSAATSNRSFGIAYATEDTLVARIKASEAYKELEKEVETRLEDARVRLEEAQVKLDEAQEEYSSGRAQADKSFAEAEAKLAETKEKLEKGQAELDAQKRLAAKNPDAAGAVLVAKQRQLDAGLTEYENAMSELNTKKHETYVGLDKARDELDISRAELSEGWKDYETQREQAEKELERAATGYQEILFVTDNIQSTVDTVKDSEYYISHVERENQPSYVNVSSSLDPIRSVSYIFPLIFFLVAAVVAFISISKTVENQRTQIAVMQALGISKGKIRLSFLTYALMASVFGSIPFALLGNALIPKLLLRVFMSRFQLPDTIVPVYGEYIAYPLLLAMLFCGIASMVAAQRVLREIPAQAMRPRPPRDSKIILLERFVPLWTRLSYSGKLIARNIFLNKGRVLLSSVGVIGSVMLIMTGLSLQHSAKLAISTYTDSMDYELSVVYKEPVEDKDGIGFAFNYDRIEYSETDKVVLKLSEDEGVNLQLTESGTQLVHLTDINGKTVDFKDNSVVIPDSLADEYGISVGDILPVEIDGEIYNLSVTDISVQYVSKAMYVSFGCAEATGIDTSARTLLVRLPEGSDMAVAADTLSGQEGVRSVSTKAEIIDRSRELTQTLDAVILIILVSAAVLAVTVIYNITSISIFERTREYATLLVLGYYKNEVNKLTLIENLVLSFFGCLLGLPLGYLLFKYLTDIISGSGLRIPDTLDWIRIALTVVLTFTFTLLSELLLRPKIKNIVLVEALKSVE